MNATLSIIEPGMFTTVQDLGRMGYQRFSMPVSGPMDPYALRVGNMLVGNPAMAAGLECTFIGPTVQFGKDTWFCLTGAYTQATLDGKPVPSWRACMARAQSVLEVGACHRGARVYLSIAGGISVEPVMGSRSTYVLAGVGGLDGRALRRGDVLPIGAAPQIPGALPEDSVVPLPEQWEPLCYTSPRPVRVVLGPQDDHFTKDALSTLFSSEYKVHKDSNRMGYRLDGTPLEHLSSADIISDATCFGAIQVPANGLPIVLMADRQTTGGYPKIGTVVTQDIPLIAQMLPGSIMRFQQVSLAEAHASLRQYEGHLELLDTLLKRNAQDRESSGRRFEVIVENTRYRVLLEPLPASESNHE